LVNTYNNGKIIFKSKLIVNFSKVNY